MLPNTFLGGSESSIPEICQGMQKKKTTYIYTQSVIDILTIPSNLVNEMNIVFLFH